MFTIGDTVRVDHQKYPGIWTVKKINRTTVDLTQDGRGPLRAHKNLVRDSDTPAATVTAVPIPSLYHPGEFIRITRGRFAGRLYVVLRDSGQNISVAPVGGDNGRYVTGLHKSNAVKVDASEVLK